MNKLTADDCKAFIATMRVQKSHGILSIAGEYYLQAMEIALPVLEQQESTTDTYQQIENDGWIDWGGFGGCPVHDDVDCVEIKTRAGLNFKIIPGDRSWLHYGNHYDIIAYRVIENDGREG